MKRALVSSFGTRKTEETKGPLVVVEMIPAFSIRSMKVSSASERLEVRLILEKFVVGQKRTPPFHIFPKFPFRGKTSSNSAVVEVVLWKVSTTARSKLNSPGFSPRIVKNPACGLHIIL